jgi:cation:H+ antiporter
MFHDLPLAANAGLFTLSAVIVWAAGTRLARAADAIAEKTGIGRAVLGILLLGGVTSLPELAVGVTSALADVPELSVNDVLGSAAINVVVLAIADAALGKNAITSMLASPAVMLQGVLGIILLALVVGAVLVGDVLVLGVGAWSWLIVGAYFVAIWVIAKSQGVHAWVPVRRTEEAHIADDSSNLHRLPLSRLIAQTSSTGVAILVGGFLLARTAEALAEQTSLGTNFVGAVMLGMATSLPEVSTAVAAVRLRRYEMAIADVFGTNLFNVTIIFIVDAVHPGPPVLVAAGSFAAFGALIAIVLTGLFVAGMIERRDRTVFRMGIDSLTAICVYAAGVVVLYQLR